MRIPDLIHSPFKDEGAHVTWISLAPSCSQDHIPKHDMAPHLSGKVTPRKDTEPALWNPGRCTWQKQGGVGAGEPTRRAAIRQAAEEPAKGGHWGHLCRAQLVPVSRGCLSQGQLSYPVYTGTDLPLTPWNVCLEACSAPASSAHEYRAARAPGARARQGGTGATPWGQR